MKLTIEMSEVKLSAAAKIIAKHLQTVSFVRNDRGGLNDEDAASEAEALIKALMSAGFRIVESRDGASPETHILAKLTVGHIDFLERVRDGKPLRLAFRDEDRIRQFCRKYGLAKVEANPRRWVLTAAGEAALQSLNEQSR